MNKQGQENLKAEIEQNGYAIRRAKLPRKLKKRIKKNKEMIPLQIFHRTVARIHKSVFEFTLDKKRLSYEN